MKKNKSLFGLPDKVKFCSRCVISNQRPNSTVEFKSKNRHKKIGIVFDENNQLLMVIGSPGGSRIISYIVKTLIAVLDFNYNINDAIKLPNYTKMSEVLELEEETYLDSFQLELEQKGHKLRIRDLTSGLHGVLIENDKLYSGVDPRREGKAEGF